MLTHTRAIIPSDGVEFGNMNGFFVTEATTGTLTCTLWNPDENDSTVRTVVIQAGVAPSSFIPLAVKKIVASVTADLPDVVVLGV